jgi:hypothetical protein
MNKIVYNLLPVLLIFNSLTNASFDDVLVNEPISSGLFYMHYIQEIKKYDYYYEKKENGNLVFTKVFISSETVLEVKNINENHPPHLTIEWEGPKIIEDPDTNLYDILHVSTEIYILDYHDEEYLYYMEFVIYYMLYELFIK